ncbi:helix-turn-helix domain-containing protein [Arcticibacter tournemirensis]
MENLQNGKNLTNYSPVYRDQLLTVQDLLDFKQQLLSEIKDLIQHYPPRQEKQWLKAFEIKKMLRLSSGKLQYLRDKGVIPFKKLGGVTYYDLEKIQELMATPIFKEKLKIA